MSKQKNVFDLNPGLKAYHETSDGMKFSQENAAKNYAKRLSNRRIKTVTRGETMSDIPVVKDTGSESEDYQIPEGYEDWGYEKRAEFVSELNTVEAIDKTIADETSKTVKEAGAQRIAQINATDALNSEDENENVTEK